MDQLDTPIDVPNTPAPQDGFTVGATAILAERRLHTLKYGDLFGVFDQNGNILSGPGIADGLYYLDTRHLSSLTLSICGQAPILLSATLRENNATLSCDLTNPDLQLDGHKLSHDLLHMRRTLFLRDRTAHERLQIRNYDVVAHTVVVELAFRADFADLFEARGTPRLRRGTLRPTEVNGDTVLLAYDGLDDRLRTTRLRFSPRPERLTESRARFSLTLQPGQRQLIHIETTCNPDRPPERGVGGRVPVLAGRGQARAARVLGPGRRHRLVQRDLQRGDPALHLRHLHAADRQAGRAIPLCRGALVQHRVRP